MSIFTKNKRYKVPRSRHNLSHSNILTMYPGDIVPINVEELAPTEKIGYKLGYSMMTDALFAPVMQDMRVCVRDFIVPHRLLFRGFEDFIAMNYKTENNQQVLKVSETPYTTVEDLVRVVSQDGSLKWLADYLRYNYGDLTASNVADSPLRFKHVSLMPLLAYYKIYLDWFNDENLNLDGKKTWDSLQQYFELNGPYVPGQMSFQVYYPDGTHQASGILRTLFSIRLVAQPKNYFSSALLSQQKGPAARVPFSTGEASVLFRVNDPGTDSVPTTASRLQPYTLQANQSETEEFAVITPPTGSTAILGKLYADLASVDSPTIVEYRTREALQKFMERNNVGGTRYVEFLKAHFGSNLPDPFAQRSQYLHGMKFPLSASPVFSHAETSLSQSQTTLLGDYAGKLESRNSSSYCGFFAKEHCFHVTVAYVQVPVTCGIDGLPRINERTKALDYMIPEFSNVGEQPIHSTEMYMKSTYTPDDIFGYTPRYADFKSHLNEVHGDFRTTLNYWHAGLIGSQSDYKSIDSNLVYSIGKANNVRRMFSTNQLQPFRFWFYFDYRKTSPCTR